MFVFLVNFMITPLYAISMPLYAIRDLTKFYDSMKCINIAHVYYEEVYFVLVYMLVCVMWCVVCGVWCMFLCVVYVGACGVFYVTNLMSLSMNLYSWKVNNHIISITSIKI